YLAAMLEGGEDPRFIARRMVVLASEDIGNADPQALLVAVAAAQAVEHVGLPEARLNLAQAAIYLARAPKSNASYVALNRATADCAGRRRASGGEAGPDRRRHCATAPGRAAGWGTARATSIPTTIRRAPRRATSRRSSKAAVTTSRPAPARRARTRTRSRPR